MILVTVAKFFVAESTLRRFQLFLWEQKRTSYKLEFLQTYSYMNVTEDFIPEKIFLKNGQKCVYKVLFFTFQNGKNGKSAIINNNCNKGENKANRC